MGNRRHARRRRHKELLSESVLAGTVVRGVDYSACGGYLPDLSNSTRSGLILRYAVNGCHYGVVRLCYR